MNPAVVDVVWTAALLVTPLLVVGLAVWLIRGNRRDAGDK